jgi:hypothetical protein
MKATLARDGSERLRGLPGLVLERTTTRHELVSRPDGSFGCRELMERSTQTARFDGRRYVLERRPSPR